MDEKVAKWILEFLLRHPIDEKLINGVLSCLPLPDDDNRLKKTILLRKIESETSNGCVSEKLLELLEILEELDHKEGKMASNSMKEAYCAVAVDCTVRFLEENVEENGKYFEAVERVWRNRVCNMECLLSDESRRWLQEIEGAVWDSGVCEKILMRNTRNEALKAVKGYLKEEWKSMGPSFLELVASKVGDDVVEELRRGGSGAAGGGGTVAENNSCRELVASRGLQKGLAPVRRKHVAVKNRYPRGAKISDAVEEDTEESNNASTHNLDVVQEAQQPNSTQLDAAAVSDPNPDASEAAHNLSFTKASDNMSNVDGVENQTGHGLPATPEACRGLEAPHCSNMELHAAVTDPLRETSSAKETDNRSNEIAVGNQTRLEIHATAEVIRVQKALNSSSRELHAAVKDPLPEALQIAALASKGVAVNHETAIELQTAADIHAIPEVGNPPCDVFKEFEYVSSKMKTNNISNDSVLANQKQPGIHAPREAPENNSETLKKKDELTGNAQGDENHDPTEHHKRKRSLMEPNGTSCTLQWDDSPDNVSRGSSARPRLPSSTKRNRVSPLRQYEEKKFSLRRERKKWTPDEEDTLRAAVKKFNRRWKLIRECYSDVFKDRTDVDLKDKWRNMTRS